MLLAGVLTLVVSMHEAAEGLVRPAVKSKRRPHIVMIVADDLGWDDVGYHGSKQVSTPNIDSLARNGVMLENYYVQPVCTPTRAALMTGRYPIHNGMQKGVILASRAWGLGLNETLLPRHLKELGYRTHAIGKWHLGFYAKPYLPTERGFDSFYGFYNGALDYFNRSVTDRYSGFDLQRNGKPARLRTGQYSTEIFTAEAEHVIRQHNTSEPLFLYIAHQAAHSPLQAPKDWIERFSHIEHEGRRKYAAMVAYLDYSVGRIYNALVKKKMSDDLLLVFTTDNGGPADGFDGNFASNYPLRGMKRTLWEGGVRAVGFIFSPILRRPGRVFDGLMHVTDWLPTLVAIAGGNASAVRQHVDGHNMWDALQSSGPSSRKEILLNIMEEATGRGLRRVTFLNAALRMGDWKLIMGQPTGRDGWYRPPASAGEDPTNNFTTVYCGLKPSKIVKCDQQDGPCLFNVRHDPCEYRNLRERAPSVFAEMKKRLSIYRDGMVPPLVNSTVDPRSDPNLHGGFWIPYVTL